VISPQHAYLITDILADNNARAPAFGRDNPLKLSRPATAKTGTTDDWRDAWTLGYTPELVAGVWVGNADNTPMKNVSGSRGAGPIWHNFMERALAGQPASQFARPEGIDVVEISADAGSLPSEACPPDRRRSEIFASGQGPQGPEYDFHQFVRIDVSTDGLATEYCPANLVKERYYIVLPGEEGQYWAQKSNLPQPPAEFCPVHTGPADVALFQPLPGEMVAGEVYVVGRANMPGFSHYVVEYGEGQNPVAWGLVAGPVYAPVDSGLLAVWDARLLANRDYALRVVVYDQAGNGFEARTWVVLQNALPTVTLTPTWTPTPSSTPTLAPTLTLPPSATPVPTQPPEPTSTPSPLPTDTPWPTATPPPVDTPTPTATSPLPKWTPPVTITLTVIPTP
jgi:membrane peptidoglycan carboxypeptidase